MVPRYISKQTVSSSASELLFGLICFTASLKVRSTCTTSFPIQISAAIMGEFFQIDTNEKRLPR